MKTYSHNKIAIRNEVLTAFGFTHDDLLSARRTKTLTAARDIIIGSVMELCGCSGPETAEFVGHRAPSSALYARRRFLAGDHSAYPVAVKYLELIEGATE